MVHGRRPRDCQQRSSPAHLYPHEPFPPAVLLLTAAQRSSCSLFKNTFVLILSKPHCQDDDLSNAHTEKFQATSQFHTCSPKQGCLSLQQIIPYSHLDFSTLFCLSFQIISTSAAETTNINYFLQELCIDFLRRISFFFPHTRLVQILFPYLMGLTRCGQWCH